MAQAPTHQAPTQVDRDGALRGLRDVPGLSLRVGRHLTAWLLWQTTRVSLIEDGPPPSRRERAARV